MTSSPADPDPAPVPAVATVDCVTAVRRLWLYLDGALDDDAATADAVRAHLEECAHCRPHTDFGRALRRSLAAARPGTSPDVAALRATIARALQEARQAGA